VKTHICFVCGESLAKKNSRIFFGFFLCLVKFCKTQLLVPGEGPFSNANIVELDQLIAETKTDLKL
jgi:hypothetical protein